MITEQLQQSANSLHSQYWLHPNTLVGTGDDKRSSEDGLLTIFYGTMANAAQLQWNLSTSTIIDGAYLKILWQAINLEPLTSTDQDIAAALQVFILTEIEPLWEEFDMMSHDEKHEQAIRLIKLASVRLFGTEKQERAASWLLYYLLPQLPIFPMNKALCIAVTKLQHQEKALSYVDYHATCRNQLSRLLPYIHSGSPTPAKSAFGTKEERKFVDDALKNGNWWQRCCFIKFLQY